MTDTLDRLQSRIHARRTADPSDSYVAKLLSAGRERMAQKVGEEAVEAVIAAVRGDDRALISEVADLVFHLAVLLDSFDLGFGDIMAELDRREGISGIAEKRSRVSGPGKSGETL